MTNKKENHNNNNNNNNLLNECKNKYIGQTKVNNQGHLMTLIKYNNYKDIIVQFSDGKIKHAYYTSFSDGALRHPSDEKIKNKQAIKERIGEVNYNTYGSKMTIIRYNNSQDIDVEFDNGYKVHGTFYKQFKQGKIANPYDKTATGVGYLGEGPYTTRIELKEHAKIAHSHWRAMLKRCYADTTVEGTIRAYSDCIVVDEWHNFQNFAAWHEQNYYNVENYKMNLDKDLLVKDNKIYGPDTCIYIPSFINNMVKKVKLKGDEALPTGVVKASLNSYRVDYRRINRGSFRTKEEAFNVYKELKEAHMYELANEFKDKLPEQVFKALLSYKVEITD